MLTFTTTASRRPAILTSHEYVTHTSAPTLASHTHSHGQSHTQRLTLFLILLQAATLLGLLLSCLPAHPSCRHIPRTVMHMAAQPLQPVGATGCLPSRAVCALAGWCAEGWLHDDNELLEEAAATLTTALQHYCEPRPCPLPDLEDA
jgi:hypothetical protein